MADRDDPKHDAPGEGSGAASRGRLARAAGLVGAITLLSRILGLVRDGVVAAFFPRGQTDAYYVAFTIPNVLRRLLAEGALTVAFIPVFTEFRDQRGEASAREMLANALGAALLVLAGTSALGMLFAPQIVTAFAYGIADEPERFGLAVSLTRIMFPFLVTVGLVALAMGALNTCRHFAAPALAPVVLNLGIIGTVVAGQGVAVRCGWPPITALGCGVVLGGVGQVLLQLPLLGRHRVLVWPRFNLRHEGVVRVARLMLPSIFGVAIYQLNVIVAREFASFLEQGAISYLYYAQRLIEFPLGIFAVAMATVTMPKLSRHATAGDLDQLKDTYRFGLRLVLFVLLPATAGLVALAVPLCAVLFQRGAFTAEMAQQTGVTLVAFAVGLVAAGGARLTSPVFYALQDTRTPVKVSAVGLVVYVGAALLLFRPWGTVGLALAVAIASTANFSLLLLLLRRRLGPIGLAATLRSATRSSLAAVCCAAAAWAIARGGSWRLGGGAPGNYVRLLAAVAGGVAVYTLVCALLRAPELAELLRALRRRRGANDER